MEVTDITEEIPELTEYSGTVPNKATAADDDEFASQVEPYLKWINDTFVAAWETVRASINTLIGQINTIAGQVQTLATETSDNADIAKAVANNKGAWSGLSGAYGITPYSFTVSHSNRVWLANVAFADITASEPSAGNSDWTLISVSLLDQITTTPALSGNTSGTEGTVVEVPIDNYSATATYTDPVVSGGSAVRTDGVMSWTLPTLDEDADYTIKIQATEPNKLISDIATHTVTVLNLDTTLDQTILFENTTITATEFPTVTGVDLSGNTLLATADNATATSYAVYQNLADKDFALPTPTEDNTAKLYTIDSATSTSVTLSELSITEGDILLINDGATTTLQAFDTTGNYTNNGDGGDGSLNTSTADSIPTMTSATAPSGVVSASSSDPSFDPYLAFDDVVSGSASAWLTLSGETTGYLQYEYSVKTAVNKYTIRSRDISGQASRAPKDWTLEASNTGAFSGEEIILDTVTNETTWGQSEERTYTFLNPTSYKYYRLVITANNGDLDYVQIGEVELIEANVSYIIDLTDASLSSAPTIVAKNTPISKTSLVGQSYTIAGGATTTSVTITGADNFTIGDDIGVNDGTETLTAFTTSGSNTTDNGSSSYTIDITSLGNSNPPTLVTSDMADSFTTRVAQSYTADAEPSATKITTVYNKDPRVGRVFKTSSTFLDKYDEITRKSIPIDKVV